MDRGTDFICLKYKNTDFLFEKELITESLYFEQKQQSIFSRKIKKNGKQVTVYDLDCIIQSEFNDSGVSGETILMRIDNNYVETSAHAFVQKIELQQFRLFGKTMDSFCQKKGLIAVRFSDNNNNNRIQYLLDIDKIIKAYKAGIK